VSKRRIRSRGSAMLELVLIAPWIFFLFIGALDWGFYAYALISVQSAARSAALYTSSSSTLAGDASAACTVVLAEMRSLPNVGAGTTTCTSNPVVTATSVTVPTLGASTATASQISVVYQSISLVPIPALLPKQFTARRTVTMRVRT
jgi:Flp pilus assembly protein TadG